MFLALPHRKLCDPNLRCGFCVSLALTTRRNLRLNSCKVRFSVNQSVSNLRMVSQKPTGRFSATACPMSKEVHSARLITEKLQPHLTLLFVGFNPSLMSHERGFNYAGRNNRFYRILFDSGLTLRQYRADESPNLLDDYGYGFTNLVSRPTQRADQVSAAEYEQGAQVLRAKLRRFQPRIACYVGKGVYEHFARRRGVRWGFQDDPVIDGVIDFVGPSSSGLVRMKLDEQVAIYSDLSHALSGTGRKN